MGQFQITRRKNNEFQFNLKADNGQVILTSEGYKSKDSCKKGIESVRRNSVDQSKFDHLASKNGKFYFTLHAVNRQIIGVSEMYESEASRDNGIKSVMNAAPNAKLVDLTLKEA